MPRSWDNHFDDNRSIWLADNEPYDSAPPLERDLKVDVAIVGGGFTGVSTAYHLSERFPDKGIALLEARTLANGASGRNGGQMLHWVQGFELATLEQARRVYDATGEGIDTIVSLIQRHDLRVSYRREGHLEVYTNPRNAELAARRVESLRQAGLPLRFLSSAELARHVELQGVAGAVLDPGGGQLDGLAFVRGLRPVLEARGVSIYENTPILSIREGAPLELRIPSGTVKASAVVLATNAYTPHLGYFRNRLFALHSHVLGSESLSHERWAALGWKRGVNFTDDRGRLSYGALTATGRLVFGGGSNAAYHYAYGNATRLASSDERAFEANRRCLLEYLPRLREVPISRRWSGPIALTLSRLCSMGVRGDHRNVYFALGYSGHGVTLANLAGKVLCDLYSGADERWRGLPFYQQSLGYIPPEPFRYLGYHAYTRLTGRSPRIETPV